MANQQFHSPTSGGKVLSLEQRLILLAVVPACLFYATQQCYFWFQAARNTALFVVGFAFLMALIAIRLRSLTPLGAATGAVFAINLGLGTLSFPYTWWQNGLLPLASVAVITGIATRAGKAKKQRRGLAEGKHGRNAAQVAANIGPAALAVILCASIHHPGAVFFAPLLMSAALAEAAADTASSEFGTAFGGRPRMLTNFRLVEPGTDGAVSVTGTAMGLLAAALVTASCWLCFHTGLRTSCCIFASAAWGLLFDSLLGATLERKGFLGNDAVNFLSSSSAALVLLALLGWS